MAATSNQGIHSICSSQYTIAMQNLFTYGTLRDPLVQQMLLGRLTPGTPDTLDGYGKCEITLESNTYPIIHQQPGRMVNGLVIAVTADELKTLDEYETDAYQRVRVTLRSGIEAWVYGEPG